MRLDLSEDQEFFRATTRRFIEAESPVASLRDLDPDGPAFSRQFWQHAAQLGWTSLLASESAGGGSLSGAPLSDAVIVAEEMGRQVCPGPLVGSSVLCAALSAAGGHDEVLAQMVEGTSIGTWAIAGTEGRWDLDELPLVLEHAAEGLVLSGVASFVEEAAAADFFVASARSPHGVSQVLVAASHPGVTVRAGRSLDLGRRFGTVRFDAVELESSSLVGVLDGAAQAVRRQVALAIALQCAETVGVLDRVVEFTLAYMQDRYAFGRPIASYQALKHRMADICLWLESAKATTDALAAALDDDDGDDAARLAAVAKAYVGERALPIIQECVQFHGGIGVTWEHDLHLYLRRATVNRAILGTPELHRDRLGELLEREVA